MGIDMHYLKMEHIKPGMILAKSVVGDNGNVLLRNGKEISDTILKRIIDMGFQGAYIENPEFSDIVVEDIITDEIGAKAFEALSTGAFQQAASIAKTMVQELKYKEVLKLDLLDIKNDKNYVFKHSISVCIFAIVLGISYGLNEDQLNNLAVAGILHDIGKLEIKKRVLNAKNIYTERQLDEMKKHPVLAYETLKEVPWITSVSRNAILFHHENLDGTGYYEIPGEKLGVFPRILRVVDTYDA
ncbi:MAG: HD domain-containing protein, partial [Lachnospiraceae bacterium]